MSSSNLPHLTCPSFTPRSSPDESHPTPPSYSNPNSTHSPSLTPSSNQMQQILDSIPPIQFLPDGVLIVNESIVIIDCNTACEQLFGYTRAELLGQPVSILVPPEYRGHHDALTSVVYDSMQPRQMGERKSVSGYHRSGTRFEVSIHLAPSYVRSNVKTSTITNGILVETTQLHKIVTCVCRDMSSHKAQQELLIQSEERQRLLIDSVVDYAIFTLNPDGVITSWNSGAQRLKGYASQEIIGKHFSIFYTSSDIAAGKPPRELQIATETGRFEEEGYRCRKDGSRFWANVVITAMRSKTTKELLGFAKVTRDITERKPTPEKSIQQSTAAESFQQADISKMVLKEGRNQE